MAKDVKERPSRDQDQEEVSRQEPVPEEFKSSKKRPPGVFIHQKTENHNV